MASKTVRGIPKKGGMKGESREVGGKGRCVARRSDWGGEGGGCLRYWGHPDTWFVSHASKCKLRIGKGGTMGSRNREEVGGQIEDQ